MSAEAIARLRKYVDGTATLGDSRSRVDDLRALLDAHAALEAAHTEALDALLGLTTQPVAKPGWSRSWDEAMDAARAVLAKAGSWDEAMDAARAVLAKAGRR